MMFAVNGPEVVNCDGVVKITLEEVNQEYAGSQDSSLGDKVMKADTVMGIVHNAIFLLSLGWSVDIYSVYSTISENFQVVKRMPFDRMEKFNNSLKQYRVMLEHVNPLECKDKDQKEFIWLDCPCLTMSIH